MTSTHYIIGVTVMLCLMTIVTRSLPFVFGEQIKHHPVIIYLGKQLPTSIIVLLAFYYMAHTTTPAHWHQWVWEGVAIIAAFIAHYHWRQMTISLLVGTAVYFILLAAL